MFFLALKVFLARIVDVGIGVVRTIFIVKGNKFISSILAFIEIMVWYYAARTALINPNNSLTIVISYALGYTVGTLLGMIINDHVIKGVYTIRIITDAIDLEDIKNKGYGCSALKLENNKKMIFIDISKKKYKECIKYINKLDKNAFVVVNDAKISFNGFI